MGRRTRVDSTGAWFHVFNRGVAKRSIFGDDRDRIEFGRLLGLMHERHGVVVHSYCLMTNHYHLLLRCPAGQLSEAMHLVGSLYVRYFNDRHGRDGPLFRSRFGAKPVSDDAYLLRLVRYIHRNPLAIVAIDRLVDFRWSSLRTGLGYRRSPGWLDMSKTVERCGGLDAFERLVLQDDAALDAVSPVDLLHAIELVQREHASGRAVRGPNTLAVLMLDRLDPEQGHEIVEHLGYPNASALRAAQARARRQLTARPDLRPMLEIATDLAA